MYLLVIKYKHKGPLDKFMSDHPNKATISSAFSCEQSQEWLFISGIFFRFLVKTIGLVKISFASEDFQC